MKDVEEWRLLMLDIIQYKDKFKPAKQISCTAFVCKIPKDSAVLDHIVDYKAYSL